MKQAIFYHAGCPVCVSAEQQLLALVDKSNYQIEVVHLAEKPERFVEAEVAGVKSVPALVVDSNVLHINLGATMSEVKQVLGL